jgi:hypothetical protein
MSALPVRSGKPARGILPASRAALECGAPFAAFDTEVLTVEVPSAADVSSTPAAAARSLIYKSGVPAHSWSSATGSVQVLVRMVRTPAVQVDASFGCQQQRKVPCCMRGRQGGCAPRPMPLRLSASIASTASQPMNSKKSPTCTRAVRVKGSSQPRRLQ